MISIMVVGTSEHQRNAKTWCLENVGDDWWSTDFGTWSWTNISAGVDSDVKELRYDFEHERDAIEFALRWR